MRKYFEIEAKIKLYDSTTGRKTFISDGYRPHIYFGFSDPATSMFSSDCIVRLPEGQKLFPGKSKTVHIWVLKFEHLELLLQQKALLKIKEGLKFIGEGSVTKPIGVKNLILNRSE